MTLNMLRTSRRDPSKSAYEALEGPFDYNLTPIAPIGTPALLYDDPTERGTFAPHGTDGVYAGPAMEHYRNEKFWVERTRKFRITGSRTLFPAHCSVPSISEADQTILAASDLLGTLKLAQTSRTTEKTRHVAILLN